MTLNVQATEFFQRYGSAFDDGEKIAKFYGECAIASTPQFVGCLKGKEEIHTALNSVAESQKRTGMTSLVPANVEAREIDSLHVWVKVRWAAKFKKTGEKAIEFDISYLLRQNEGRFVILTYISHQDEQQLRQEYGLT
jgi:hypothetical protein